MEIIERDVIDYNVEGNYLNDIVNYNEYLVLKIMKDIFAKNKDLCRCSLCVEDIYVLSLNSLPPRYIQITSYKKYEESRNFIDEHEVRLKVLEAVSKIKNNPRH
ncbi:competence protein ComFB [Candidatus Magnetomoraceae bacterium gMMP-15]